MLKVREDGWLDGAVQIPSHRYYDHLDAGPLGICWHTTDSLRDPRSACEAIVPSSASDLRSWHFLIGRDGTIYQSVSIRHGAWHVMGAGKVRGVERRINRCLLGVELENAGRLRCLDDGHLHMWPFRPDSPVVEESRACAVGHLLWDGFPSAQVDAAETLVRCLAPLLEWDEDDCSYTHAQFSSNREDPGPLWSREILPALLAEVFSSPRLGGTP